MYLLPIFIQPFIMYVLLVDVRTSITMSSPLRAHQLRPSPLTNSKLLDKFKGVRPITIKIEDVHELGDRYQKKETSIR